ncbi:MAG: hypothetical protein WKF96_22245 [Solirubrobacteraceae bacterium]
MIQRWSSGRTRYAAQARPIDGRPELFARIRELLKELDAPAGLLPSALEWCRYCGEVRDKQPGGSTSLCLCQGIRCRYCRAGRVRRPISEHYCVTDHRLWHTAHFGNRAPCRHCRELATLSGYRHNSWPPPRAIGRYWHLAGAISAAAQALKEQGPMGEDLPGHDLIALHGPIGAWNSLWLGAPPDDRPLFVGRSLEPLRPRLRWIDGLSVATWKSRGGPAVDAVLEQLLIRWRPPLNDDVETPWPRDERRGLHGAG